MLSAWNQLQPTGSRVAKGGNSAECIKRVTTSSNFTWNVIKFGVLLKSTTQRSNQLQGKKKKSPFNIQKPLLHFPLQTGGKNLLPLEPGGEAFPCEMLTGPKRLENFSPWRLQLEAQTQSQGSVRRAGVGSLQKPPQPRAEPGQHSAPTLCPGESLLKPLTNHLPKAL